MGNYFKFDGSIGRAKYFEALIVAFLVGFLGVLISASLGKNFPNSAIFIAYLIIFVAVIPATLITAAAAIKRARDIEISLWWLILLLIPLANVAIGIFLLFAKGKGLKSKPENILTTVNLDALGDVDITSTHSIGEATVKKIGLEPTEDFWAQALHECDSATQKPGLWAKAFADAAADERLAKASYIRLRAEQLQEQFAKHQYALRFAAEQELRAEEDRKKAQEAEVKELLAKMTEAKRAEALLPKGKCPACEEVILLASKQCPKCTALFTTDSNWKVQPLSKYEAIAQQAVDQSVLYETRTKEERESGLAGRLVVFLMLLVFCIAAIVNSQ